MGNKQIDIDVLEALTKAAIINDDPEDWPLASAVGWDDAEANALIAALTPGAILDLIAKLRRARECIEKGHLMCSDDETIRSARAETWDEAIATVFAWWSASESERPSVIVNPYGTAPIGGSSDV